MAQDNAEQGLAKRLKDALAGYGLHVVGKEVLRKDVAELADMEEGTVNRYFRGETLPSLDTIVVLARVLHVDPGWLAFGDLSNAPKPPWLTLTPAPTARPRSRK